MPGQTAVAGGKTLRMTTAAGLLCMATSTNCAGADVELGRYLASECMTCHRAQATKGTIPNLIRMPAEHIIAAVKAYRSKELPNPAMQNVAGRLGDDDIESLALYFSTTKQP